MNRLKLAALAVGLMVLPVASQAQQRDTLKADTAKKETKAEKIGRQTGTSLDKAAKTTEHNAKVLSKRTAANTKAGAKDTKSDVKKIAGKAAKATKTNARHLKEDVKKATADTIKLPPKPDSVKVKPSSAPQA
ncbi:MAG TPA: hypothetical protein VM076_05940 [Gemmatimonadaceae bacterium]|nr:hypothetical protein [Gemmatimonadaceae bacterium]